MKAKEQDEIKRWEKKLCRESKSPEAMATSLCGYGYYDPNGVPKEAIVKYLAMGAEWQREHVWHDPDEVPDVDAAMAEVEEKAKAFTAAHQGETADDILAAMRGEEPSGEDLDEEIARYFVDKLGFQRHGEVLEIDNLSIHVDDLLHIARHFANWQKQQMMKDVKEAHVIMSRITQKSVVPILSAVLLDENKYREGDKVKLIIVKDSI